MNLVTLPNGRITSDSKAQSVMGRVTRCSGCGYEQDTVLSYQQDKKLWEATHTLDFCRQRKNDLAIEEMLDFFFR